MKVDVEEALRYLGARGAPQTLREQVEAAAEEVSARFQPRYAYRVFPLERTPEGVAFSGSAVCLAGDTAARMLAQCGSAALLACTLGARFDLSLAALQRRDMARAVIWDACGSALVERGCDAAAEALAARFPACHLTDRFSPGYGDLPLSAQVEICAALDAARRLGLHVTDRLLLNPLKSVTAAVGLADRPQAARIRGCAYCQMRENCALYRGGRRCGE